MKLLWVCNMIPGEVQGKIYGKAGSGFWVDHVLSDIRERKIPLHILCRGGDARGELDEFCSFALFPAQLPQIYSEDLENFFLKELKSYCPDVIHIWGSEYGHTLAMVNAAEKAGLLHRTVISIQGLCCIYDRHYSEGVPANIVSGYTFRDFIRQDNLVQQQKVFTQRGDLERQALEKVSHVMGRTEWDKACTKAINPSVRYHTCNETMREEFYQGQWQYDTCRKHRIFASSCAYPIKGFHYLLEAFGEILKKYPDATLAVPGKDFRKLDARGRLREGSYPKYLRTLAQKYQLGDRLEILGSLSARQMKEQYLAANVFVLPSSIENSPNSLGEAMLLGVPSVAADVGGVTTMMVHNREGFVYQSTAPYMLAHYIDRVFSMEDQAGTMGQAAADHARKTHDPHKNLESLLAAYSALAE